MTRRRFLAVVLGTVAALTVVVIATAVVTSAFKSTQIRDTQKINSPITRNTDETLKLVKDCVTPGGKCYERGQRQTAEAVGSLNNASKASAAAAAACAAQPEIQGAPTVRARTAAILDCMDGTLKQR